MSDVAGHRGRVDPWAVGFPVQSILHWVALACVLSLVALAAGRAHAGTLYHCVGASGEEAYSSSPAGYHRCTKIRSFGAAAAPSRKATPRPQPSSLTRVTAAVVTRARNLARDGAQPTTLGRVRGAMVQTSAHALVAAQVQRVALDRVQGEVITDAAAPGAAADGAGSESRRPAFADAKTTGPSPPVEAGGARVLRGAVYRIVRADGNVEYTNVRPVAGARGHVVTMLFTYIATCAACDLHSPIRWDRVALNLTAYADTIRAASVEYGVDEALLRAVIHAESAFNPRALSIKGAQGLMQLMPGTASDMGVLDAFNTEQNIRGGAHYLSLLLHDFGGDERLAAAAYNAGPGAVQRYSGVPPYAETQVYVDRVGTLRKRYGAAIHPPLAARAAPGPASRR